MLETTDGGFIITGRTYSFGAGDFDVYLIKTDASGNKLWQQTFGGSARDYGYSVKETTDGDFIITGETWSFGAGLTDVYLIKTDSSGNKLWQETFGGSVRDEGQSVQETTDGGFIIAGGTYSFGAGDRDVYLIRTDSSGNKLWQKTFGGGGYDRGKSVREKTDGGFIIAGQTKSFGAGNYDVYLIKTDSSGNKLWQQTFGGSDRDGGGKSVEETTDGDFIITGETWSFGAWENDVYLIKTDSSGNKLWQQTFGGSARDYGTSVAETTDDGFIITGVTSSFGAGGRDVYLIRLTSGGDISPMVLIPAGEFEMGDHFNEGNPDELPVHTVYTDEFFIDKYEVTNAQYARFLNEYGKNQDSEGHELLDLSSTDCRIEKVGDTYQPKSGYENHPVVEVSWYGAFTYAEFYGKRLPTEAEWEKAARGGLVGKRYPWGNTITHDDANYQGTGGTDQWNGTSPVGSFPPNNYGLYDMAGNVHDCCVDWFDENYYSSSLRENPPGPSSGQYRVVRGASWRASTIGIRTANRSRNTPDYTETNVGFRCCVSEESPMSINLTEPWDVPKVGESVMIGGQLLKDGKGYKSFLKVNDSISQQIRLVETDSDGNFTFTTEPIVIADSYLISFIVDKKEIDVLNIVVPPEEYQPVFSIDEPEIQITTGVIGGSIPESDISATYSRKVASETEKTSLEDRITAGRTASVFMQKWLEENVNVVTVSYWIATGITCAFPEPVVTKATCAALVTGGVGIAKVGTIKASLKTVNELAVDDESLKKNIDQGIDTTSFLTGIYGISHSGTMLESTAGPITGVGGDFSSILDEDNIAETTLLDVSISDTNEVTGYRMEAITDDDEVIEIIATKPKPGLAVIGKSPIDLMVTAPNGEKFSKEIQEVESAKYYELDINKDGDKDDLIMLPMPSNGDYLIEVIPEPDVQSSDTYTLQVSDGETSTKIAEDELIENIPSAGYSLELVENPDGTVKIAISSSKGDVNNDGRIRSNDAILTMRLAAGLTELTDYYKRAADVNCDGKIRSNDAILIMRAAAGLIEPSEFCTGAPSISPIVSTKRKITITMEETHGVAGETVTVPLKVDDIDELAGGDISIAYDKTVLKAVDVFSASNLPLVSNINEPGVIQIAFAGKDSLNSQTIAEIKFEVVVDDISPLRIQSVELYNSYARPIVSQKIDGQFVSWAIIPERNALMQNFPNPFNPETWIPFKLSDDANVVISIYDISGQLVRKIVVGEMPAGIYLNKDRAIYWDGRNDAGERVSSGIYFYHLQAGSYTATKRMLILK